MRRLSLHPLTALDAGPAELIEIAGRLGVGRVCLFTHVPQAGAGFYPSVRPEEVPQIRHALAQAGVKLCNLEVFPLERDDRFDHLMPGLETGAQLGASKATAHLHAIDSEQQAVDRFGSFAQRAAAFGITAGLEFNNFSAVRNVDTGERIVRAAGRGTLVLDMLHFIRGGGVPDDAARVADLVRYVQLSDGPAEIPDDRRWAEALRERQLPGEGSWALPAIVRPLAADAIYEVEVPQSTARKCGIGAYERCRRAVSAARQLLKTIDDERVPA